LCARRFLPAGHGIPFMRRPHLPGRRNHGIHGPLHQPGVLLAGAHEMPGSEGCVSAAALLRDQLTC
jgi:hypothetical protein